MKEEEESCARWFLHPLPVSTAHRDFGAETCAAGNGLLLKIDGDERRASAISLSVQRRLSAGGAMVIGSVARWRRHRWRWQQQAYRRRDRHRRLTCWLGWRRFAVMLRQNAVRGGGGRTSAAEQATLRAVACCCLALRCWITNAQTWWCLPERPTLA